MQLEINTTKPPVTLAQHARTGYIYRFIQNSQGPYIVKLEGTNQFVNLGTDVGPRCLYTSVANNTELVEIGEAKVSIV